MKLEGYKTQDRLYESANSIVYRAVPEVRGTGSPDSVILKLLKEGYPSPDELTRYRQEFEITSNLSGKGIIRALKQVPHGKTLVMVVEDFGARSLADLMQQGLKGESLPIGRFLNIATWITEALGEVHSGDVIHKDINPANIVFNPETGQLKLIDFGISTRLTRQNPTVRNPEVLEGTLAYMSPEQTGRMNRSLDYRTDFYSLGVTFYELLTGELPFGGDDALSLVHAHIAKAPTPPAEIAPHVPAQLSDLVMKLLAKTAEDRYQSAYGIEADLRRCEATLTEDGDIPRFELGSEDLSNRFSIPERLYGRRTEIQKVLATFDRVVTESGRGRPGGNELLLIAGHSGIGKTALVREVHRPLTAKAGHFLSGKYDQLQQNIPYSALSDAFNGLVHQLLTGSGDELEGWREKIQEAVGRNGQVLVDVIPDLELLLGPQPEVAHVGPAEAQNRFNLVLQNLVGALSGPAHPLVLFLDDLQWADNASLEALRVILLDPAITHLMVIGAYRDNEVSPTHPFVATVKTIKEAGATTDEIKLTELPRDEIQRMLADTLHSEPEKVAPLADLVLSKTEGNPFFTTVFLQSLYLDGALEFAPGTPEQPWRWDVKRIADMAVTDNVVDLLVGRLQRLPWPSQTALQFAACIGNHFELGTLAIILEKSQIDTFNDLMPAVKEGLLVPTSELETIGDEAALVYRTLRFQHDRVQQASYSLIPEASRATVHLRIGRLLLDGVGEEALKEQIFDVVNQLNDGLSLIDDPVERLRLAGLNLRAGTRAIAATAYESAVRYLRTARELLGDNAWSDQFQLTFDVHRELARSFYLSGDFEGTKPVYDAMHEHVRSKMDRIAIFDVEMEQFLVEGDNLAAIDVQRRGIALLGEDIPVDPDALQAALDAEIAAVEGHLAGRDMTDLFNDREMTDEEQLAILRIYMGLWVAAYSAADHTLLFYCAVRSSNYCLQHGKSEFASISYLYYAFLCVALLNDPERGAQFGKLAIDLSNDYENIGVRGTVHLIYAAFINHWVQPLSTSLPYYRKGFKDLVESGNWTYGSFAALHYVGDASICGRPCTEVVEQASDYVAFMRSNAVSFLDNFMRPAVLNPLLNLMGDTTDSASLSDEFFDEESWVEAVKSEDFIMGWYYPGKIRSLYYFGHIAEALTYLDVVTVVETAVPGQAKIPETQFFMGLTILAAARDMEDGERKQELLAKSDEFTESMQNFAKGCSENFQHRADLLRAERARLDGRTWDAIKAYRAAIAGASVDNPQNEALANELLGEYWLELGDETAAAAYLTEAYQSYRHWGASEKAERLRDDRIQYVRSGATGGGTVLGTTHAGTTWRRTSVMLDVGSVVKALSVMSGEIVLERLLETLMRILMENAGAQTGALVMERKGGFVIEASASVDGTLTTMKSIPLTVDGVSQLPVSLINYVSRTERSVVLTDARDSHDFSSDPYIKSNRPRSILCTPLINRGTLIGVMYFENNLASGAFTEDRLEVVHVLSGHAAVSIENATLYAQQVEMVEAAKKFVPREFVNFLDRETFVDLKLGDHISMDMTVLFSDVRGFTGLVERMDDEEAFSFIISFLRRVSPAARGKRGFIDQYYGDGVLALFKPEGRDRMGAEDAVSSAIAMQGAVADYNAHRKALGREEIAIGVGLHSGTISLGIIGEAERLQGGVVGDPVNLASRMERLTKIYGASVAISESTRNALPNLDRFHTRLVDRVRVSGRHKPVAVYEVFDSDAADQVDLKLKTMSQYEDGTILVEDRDFSGAIARFQEVLKINPGDRVAQVHLKKAEQFAEHGVPPAWEGITDLQK